MKIKEQILKWQEKVEKLKETVSEDLKVVKGQISALVDSTNELTEALLALISQQIGD